MSNREPKTDLETAMKQMQLGVKAWAEAITEQFKPFNAALARMHRSRNGNGRSGAGEL